MALKQLAHNVWIIRKIDMKILESEKDCCGCEACFNRCPVHAIEMRTDIDGFWYPKINDDLCIGCNQCREVCPVNHKKNKAQTIKTIAGVIKDKNQYYASSSGGIFTALALQMLGNNGYVCGAAYNAEYTAEHVCSNENRIIKRIQGTKYIQSRINENYRTIEDLLKKGESVLFSGTPCQVAGLKCYLKTDYENLVCVDLICHGVPSPKIWKKYLQELQNEENISSINFREKSRNINESFFVINYKDGTHIKEKKAENLYMKGFIGNYFLRESCFNCHFKGDHRYSDITIGDFWGAKEFYPKDFPDANVSSIVIHSDKGLRYMKSISSSLTVKEIRQEEIKLWNDCFDHSVNINKKREEFLMRAESESIHDLLKEYTGEQSHGTKQSENNVIHPMNKILRAVKKRLWK